MEDETDEEVELAECPISGTKSWLDAAGYEHRLNGPAVIYADGDMMWYRHGQLHRDDGPALDWPSENRFEWYKDDEPYEPSAHELMVWKMKKNQKKKE
jgi:hypothetical protein